MKNIYKIKKKCLIFQKVDVGEFLLQMPKFKAYMYIPGSPEKYFRSSGHSENEVTRVFIKITD